eukprot:CAMPEP_0172484718 /NCGR_PEP_ID=MMETSP1066-20121228/12292_1 /TAXON_ID=671091 /ORGANISM="Coscinodiscus wailesii, Strain CCMP2513" /LENGTH=171 /DNA_ID=CAMNT_0013249413 /DNA_START=124 /DNA_END=635 /DNA_ORIENTATION=+
MITLLFTLSIISQITTATFLTPLNSSPAKTTAQTTPTTALRMAPRFDPASGKWFPTKPSEESSAGYGPLGTLLREGPPAFIKRVSNEEEYDQAVLKFMAGDGCTRREAQGNMDAYMANPNDWAFQRNEEKKGVSKRDWGAEPEGKDLALTLIWAVFITGLIIRVLYEGVVT